MTSQPNEIRGQADLDTFRHFKQEGITSYCDQICGGNNCGTGKLCLMGIDDKTKMPGPLCEKYVDTILDGGSGLFDAIEIHGARNSFPEDAPEGTCYEIDNENPQIICVYLRYRNTSELSPVGDFGLFKLANEYAKELSDRFSWSVHIGVKAEDQLITDE